MKLCPVHKDHRCFCDPRPEFNKLSTDEVIVRIREIAEIHGWAIGVHGSLKRDIDLIAVPWTQEASGTWDLFEAIRDEIGSSSESNRGDLLKPHGRQALLIIQNGSEPKENFKDYEPPAIDISFVDPRASITHLQKLCEEQKSQLATQTERVNAQDAEIEKLRAFADHILQNYSWDNYCFEIDPADAQDKAEELGLIEKRDVNPDDYDGADWAYFTKWTPKEALNQDSLGDGK